RIGLIREGKTHRRSSVVISRDCDHRQCEISQEFLEVRVFLGRSAIDEVAGYHDDRRPWAQGIKTDDAMLQGPGGVDLPIGELARSLDMQVGDLSDQYGFSHRETNRSAASHISIGTRGPARIADRGLRAFAQ